MGGVAGQRLADSLKELKQRSGLSYEELARRTFSTRSTLHRYCTGTTVPADYGIVAAIAKECGASPAELNAFLEHWTAAGNATTYTPKPTVDAPRPRRVLFAVVCVGPLVMDSNTGTMPSFRVGSVRFWDSGTRWADLEPRRGRFDWATARSHLSSLRLSSGAFGPSHEANGAVRGWNDSLDQRHRELTHAPTVGPIFFASASLNGLGADVLPAHISRG